MLLKKGIEASDKAEFILKHYDAYWVVRVPKEILHGHSGDRAQDGIFNVAMTDLMSNLVDYALPKARTSSKQAPAPPTPSQVQDKLKGLQLEAQQLQRQYNKVLQ